MTQKQRDIVFSGDAFIPSASACTTCSLFNQGCKGSVYNYWKISFGCAVTEYEDNMYAERFVESSYINGNHFVMARAFGHDLDENHLKQLEEKIAKGGNPEDVETLKQLVQNFQIAKEMEPSFIESLHDLVKCEIQDSDLPF